MIEVWNLTDSIAVFRHFVNSISEIFMLTHQFFCDTIYIIERSFYFFIRLHHGFHKKENRRI